MVYLYEKSKLEKIVGLWNIMVVMLHLRDLYVSMSTLTENKHSKISAKMSHIASQPKGTTRNCKNGRFTKVLIRTARFKVQGVNKRYEIFTNDRVAQWKRAGPITF